MNRDLTSLVKCENENKAVSTIGDMLDPVYVETDINGEQVKLQLPFVNMKYRANVRVVNFMPPDLEDFEGVCSESRLNRVY